jgi:hypothetical protein
MSEFVIRRAQIADAAIIASHRAWMFCEMAEVSSTTFGALRAESEKWLTNGLRSGEYIGWLASPADAPAIVIAGAGVQLRRVAPHPDGENAIAEGRHAVVINVSPSRNGVAGGLANCSCAERCRGQEGED